MGSMKGRIREKASQKIGGKFPQTKTPPPVAEKKKLQPDRKQVGMTTQRKKEITQTKRQQKASLTGTAYDDAGKTVLGG